RGGGGADPDRADAVADLSHRTRLAAPARSAPHVCPLSGACQRPAAPRASASPAPNVIDRGLKGRLGPAQALVATAHTIARTVESGQTRLQALPRFMSSHSQSCF